MPEEKTFDELIEIVKSWGWAEEEGAAKATDEERAAEANFCDAFECRARARELLAEAEVNDAPERDVIRIALMRSVLGDNPTDREDD